MKKQQQSINTKKNLQKFLLKARAEDLLVLEIAWNRFLDLRLYAITELIKSDLSAKLLLFWLCNYHRGNL